MIIQCVIPPVHEKTADGVTASIGALHAVHRVIHKDIVMGVTHSTAGVIKNPLVINQKEASRPIPVDENTVRIPPITTTQVLTGTGPSVSPIRIGR